GRHTEVVGDWSRTCALRIGREILKRVVMRHVVRESQRVGARVHSDEPVEALERMRARAPAGVVDGETALKPPPRDPRRGQEVARSEEHTSELQSLTNLVCRL